MDSQNGLSKKALQIEIHLEFAESPLEVHWESAGSLLVVRWFLLGAHLANK